MKAKTPILASAAVAAGAVLGVQGLETPSSAPPSIVRPIPLPNPWATSTYVPAEACGDVASVTFIDPTEDYGITARNGVECVAVYQLFTHQRVGEIAANAVFGINCSGTVPRSWEVSYGPNYSQTGAVYLTLGLADSYDFAVAKGTEAALLPCTAWPHAPYADDSASVSHR